MDVSYDNDEIIRRCFKCDEPVLSNLNVAYNASNTTVSFWNKFQIFVYENLDFESASKVIVPEFQLHSFISSSNYLVCVDHAGNIHTSSLKFKIAPQKRFKYGFQPRDDKVLACAPYGENYTICLKYELGAYFISVNKINSEFNLEKTAIVLCDEDIPLQQSRDSIILKAYKITEHHIEYLKKVFPSEVNMRHDYSLVVISFDKFSVYGGLFSTKMLEDEVSLLRLYTCPSEISSIDFSCVGDLNIVIGLTMGTLIRLNMKDLGAPIITHLNTSIHKFLVFEDSILYTDGLTMWKAENILSKDITFSQLIVKNVKDFVKFGDQVICTTFMNLIYTFSIDDERSFVKPQSAEEYCAAEQLLSHSEYFTKVIDEIAKNKSLVTKQNKEQHYVTALSLANRQDIMDKIIQQKVIVYENYEDAIAENNNVTLTNNFSEYFDKESFYFLIKLTTTEEHRLGEILSNSIGDLRIHVTLTSHGKVIKTTTVKVTEQLKKTTLLIPLKSKSINTTVMKAHLKIMTNIPGAMDTKQKLWTLLYRKTVVLNSEHFIRFNFNSNKNVFLREPKEPLDEKILEAARNQYGNLIMFTDIRKERPMTPKWHMYVRLPVHYQEKLNSDDIKKKFRSKKVSYFLHQFTSEDFLQSKSSLTLLIGKEKVQVEIHNDGFSNPSLKVSSHNVKIAADIRNFLSDLIYYVFADFSPGKEYISNSFYLTVDNLQKAVRESLTQSTEDDLLPLIEQFERKIIGSLPI
ncbi:uncharacterized protein LOC142982936 [Anticarsia gemmatalis]|uniref:uncharacterized protein LOC142982936 n=1 Tax=Anticarsia gemmatalis TaxID=129554 RepID=UPI003F759F0B